MIPFFYFECITRTGSLDSDAFPDAGSVGVTSLAGVKKMALSREISDVINAEEHVFL